MTGDINISGVTLDPNLIAEFRQKRESMEALQNAAEAAEKDFRNVEERLWEVLDAMGLKSIKVDGLGTCTRTLKGPYCSLDHDTNPDAEEAFKEWCEQQGIYSQIWRFAPQMAALNPIVKEMRARGDATPPGVKVTEHRRIQVLKGKG